MITGGAPVLVVSNRAPVTFTHDGIRLSAGRRAGGVVTALGRVSADRPVTWIGTAAGEEDRSVAGQLRARGGLVRGGRLSVRFVDLPKDLYADYYAEFSSRVLWFVQHGLWSRRVGAEGPDRVRALFRRYLAVAEAFADVVAAEAHRPGRDPFVLAQDFHLYGLPRALRERLPGLLVSHFVHVPWPSPAVWREAIPDDVLAELTGALLGADVIGFQDQTSRRAFVGTVRLALGIESGGESLRAPDGRLVRLRVRPASIEPARLRPTPSRVAALRADPRRRIVRVDRVDPIKNVPLGFEAFALMLERHPEWAGRVRFLARLVPTRSAVPEYDRELRTAMASIDRLLRRFGPESVELIVRDDRGRALAELATADVVLVNSLADGMNLVAKETAALNPSGALVLSRRAGAWDALRCGALGIDPESVEETAEALHLALSMDEDERTRRASLMRRAVESWTSSDWAEAQLNDLAEVERERAGAAPP